MTHIMYPFWECDIKHLYVLSIKVLYYWICWYHIDSWIKDALLYFSFFFPSIFSSFLNLKKNSTISSHGFYLNMNGNFTFTFEAKVDICSRDIEISVFLIRTVEGSLRQDDIVKWCRYVPKFLAFNIHLGNVSLSPSKRKSFQKWKTFK